LINLNSLCEDQSKSPPIPYSSYAGGASTFFYYFFGAFFSSTLIGAWTGAFVAEDDPTDPKKSLTFFPLRALTTALSNPADTVTPEAWMTAVNEAWLTSAPVP